MTTPDPAKQPDKSARRDANDPAVNVIRSKISALYQDEPDAIEEVLDAAEAGSHRSKHQNFMYQLSISGKPLAQIQTEWHNYYSALPDNEKHQVWQEFYAAHNPKQPAPAKTQSQPTVTPPATDIKEPTKKPSKLPKKMPDSRTVADVKGQLLNKVSAGGKISKKQHLKSLIFGLSMGSFVILIFLFSFFNERFITPFITPSRSVSSTPIIIDPNTTEASAEPKIIIPKINVEVPVVYDTPSIQEDDIQASLEDGVVHYPITPRPGEKGNSVIVGHSSNNIFNQGAYKFAFVLLRQLDEGDTFYVNYEGTRYAYRIYEKKVVGPRDVSVLGPNDKTATMTLITCDPPGTAINRLIIVAEQITPDPNTNQQSQAPLEPTAQGDLVVPGNAPSLWQRITNWLSSD